LRFWQPSLNHYCEGAEGRSTYQECNRKFVVKAAPEQSFESEHPAFDPKNILDIVKNSLDAFYRFSRPHTVIGTVKFNFFPSDLLWTNPQILWSILNTNSFVWIAYLDDCPIMGLTIYVFGQALSIISVSLLAVEKFSDISPLFFTGVLEVRPQIRYFSFKFKYPIAPLACP